MNFSNIHSCSFATADGSAVNCLVVFDHLGETPVPFTATANDVEEHGREIWLAIQSGAGGEISPYVPAEPPPVPPAPTKTELLAQLKELEAKIAALQTD